MELLFSKDFYDLYSTNHFHHFPWESLLYLILYTYALHITTIGLLFIFDDGKTIDTIPSTQKATQPMRLLPLKFLLEKYWSSLQMYLQYKQFPSESSRLKLFIVRKDYVKKKKFILENVWKRYSYFFVCLPLNKRCFNFCKNGATLLEIVRLKRLLSKILFLFSQFSSALILSVIEIERSTMFVNKYRREEEIHDRKAVIKWTFVKHRVQKLFVTIAFYFYL